MDIIGTRLKNDLLQWAERAGGHFHKAGSEWRSHCPLHGGDNKDAFAIFNSSDGKQRWKCFTGSCGQGDIYDFVMRWQNCTFAQAYSILGGEENPNPVEIARAAEQHAERAAAALQAQIEQAERALHELRHAQAWLAYHRNLLENQDARELWRQRGLPDDWQAFWKLGYCPSFPVTSEGGRWLTPTLTIPVFGQSNTDDWPVMNIRHRLLNPPKPADKYRPERLGLQAVPYIANPYTGFDTDPILIVEGEIKSMVVFSRIWHNGATVQVVGIPGKTAFNGVADCLTGHDVYICLDPDAEQEAVQAASRVKGKIIRLPVKIDDAILAGDLDAKAIEWRMRTARRA